MDILYKNLLEIGLPELVMIAIGCLLIYLAIKKEMEPSLLLPMGFGAILINLPNSGAKAVIDHLFTIGIGQSIGQHIFVLAVLLDGDLHAEGLGHVDAVFREIGIGLSGFAGTSQLVRTIAPDTGRNVPVDPCVDICLDGMAVVQRVVPDAEDQSRGLLLIQVGKCHIRAEYKLILSAQRL